MAITKEDFKRIRKQLSLTQQEFAEKMGYKSKITIAYKEGGQRTITRRDEVILAEFKTAAKAG